MRRFIYEAGTLKTRHKFILTIFIVFALCTCIDPYKPNLKGNDSFLVVDGQITNENASYQIRLSRTMQEQNAISEKVSDAVVSVSDEDGKKSILGNYGNGVYKTDSTSFTGIVGKTYTLNIKTSDGKEYESDPCPMLPVPEIDSLYYEKGVEYTNNQSETHEGINIFLDSKAGDGINNYFRWEYEETWKFRVPTVKKFEYISETVILPLNSVKEFCWKQKKSTEIIFQSFAPQQADLIKNVHITFIGPDLSDRLSIQYSILVKQYSVSEKEYKFWDNLKKVSENTGEIFGSQPYPVISNIYNVNDKNERVLGYFQVSALSQKRKDITFMELLKRNLPLFHYDCVRIETKPSDYCQGGKKSCIPPTWDELYKMWTSAHFVFIEAVLEPVTLKLIKMVFSPPECANCELTGTLVKPAFWVDRN
jgi:hypothetical protein